MVGTVLSLFHFCCYSIVPSILVSVRSEYRFVWDAKALALLLFGLKFLYGMDGRSEEIWDAMIQRGILDSTRKKMAFIRRASNKAKCGIVSFPL